MPAKAHRRPVDARERKTGILVLFATKRAYGPRGAL